MTKERKQEIEIKLKQIGRQLEALAVELGVYIDVTAHPTKEDNESFYCVSFLNGNEYGQAYSFSKTWTVDRLLNQWEKG